MNIFRRFLCILVVFMIGTFCMSACDANQLLIQPVEAPPLAPTVNSAVNVEVPEVTAPSIPEAEIAENMDSQELMASVAENLQMGKIVETSRLQMGEINISFAVTESLIEQLKAANQYTEGQPIWVIRESKKAQVAQVVQDLVIHAYEIKRNLPERSIQEIEEILNESIPVKVRLNDSTQIIYAVRDIPISALLNAGVIFGETGFGTGQIGFTDAYLDRVTYLYDQQSGAFTFVLNPTTFKIIPASTDQELAAANASMNLTDQVFITDSSGTRPVTLDELMLALKKETMNRPMSAAFVYALIVLSSNGAQEGKYVVGSDDALTFVNLVPMTFANDFLNQMGFIDGQTSIDMSLPQRFQYVIDTNPTQITPNQQ